jgi:hypothetical protein
MVISIYWWIADFYQKKIQLDNRLSSSHELEEFNFAFVRLAIR